MKNFCYAKATDKAAALQALATVEAPYIVAGATNVCLNIRDGRVNERTLVDVRDCSDLRFVREDGDYIIIGALTTIKDLENSELIEKYAHALWQSAVSFADPTTRNSATVGGNLCNASPAADTAPALLVHDAVVTLEKQGGKREVALRDFFEWVGKTVLAADEMLTEIKIKKACKTAFIKMGLRNAMAISVANVAASIKCNENGIEEIKLAMGSVAPTPKRLFAVEKALVGKKADDLAKVVADHIFEDVSPIDDVRATAKYRRQVAPVLVTRAIKAACTCEGGAK